MTTLINNVSLGKQKSMYKNNMLKYHGEGNYLLKKKSQTKPDYTPSINIYL